MANLFKDTFNCFTNGVQTGLYLGAYFGGLYLVGKAAYAAYDAYVDVKNDFKSQQDDFKRSQRENAYKYYIDRSGQEDTEESKEAFKEVFEFGIKCGLF